MAPDPSPIASPVERRDAARPGGERDPVLAFVHIEKTAGTTMKFVLRNTFGRDHCDSIHSLSPVFTEEDYRRARRFFPHMKSLCGHNLVCPTDLLPPEVRYYTVLREPVARTVSQYQDHCLRQGEERPLEEWLRDPNLHDVMVRRIAGSDDLARAKQLLRDRYLFAGLTERFEETLRLLAHHSPYPLDLGYFVRNAASSNQHKKRILGNAAQVALLEEANQLDLALYRYVADELFPAALAALPDDAPRPRPGAYTRRTWRERGCDFYNKNTWRQANKLRAWLGR